MPIIQPTPIDQLPQPPNPADRSSFNSLAYPFTAAMLPMTVQINKAISDMYNNALEAEAKAAAAGSSATAAAGSATAANTAKTGAETARTGAETARTGAQSSATAAANSAAAANTARAGAEAARDAAAQSATAAAQSAADAAGVVQGNFGPAIHAATAKSKPADADELAVADSQASWSLRKLTWSNLKAAIWAAFKAIATGGNAKDTLGLGTAATRDVGTDIGNVMGVGAFGVGMPLSIEPTRTLQDQQTEGFGIATKGAAPMPSDAPWGIGRIAKIVYIGHKVWGTQVAFGYGANEAAFRNKPSDGNYHPWNEFIHTGNILHTAGQSDKYPMTQKAVTDAIANIDVSGPRPVKNHGAVATAGSQTVVCNVQESDFHMLDMSGANTTGTLTIDFANMPDTVGKHFSWHVRLRRGGRKGVNFAQTISWAGGSKPSFGNTADSYDIIMFYKVGNETIRGMVVDVY